MYNSDSDSDTQNSVLTFRSQGTIISAKGPNISRNLTNFSTQNNMLTSTMNVPWNRPMNKPRYCDSIYDQRSRSENHFGGYLTSSQRETSPRSTYSAADMHMQTIHSSIHTKGFSSHRSMYNGRSGSPFSVRTMNSNASVITVKDVVEAFKTGHLNKKDWIKISEACNKYRKNRLRKRIEKKRKLRLRARHVRRRSGYDPGEQGSISSISSDDCYSPRLQGSTSPLSSDDCRSSRSYRTAMPKDSCILSDQQSRLELQDFRRTVQDSEIYKDCTSNFKQNYWKNKIPQNQSLMGQNQATQMINPSARFQNQCLRGLNQSTISQKERFTNGFLLPSARFNKTLIPISEKPIRTPVDKENTVINNKQGQQKAVITYATGFDYEQDEIVSKATKEKTLQAGKESRATYNKQDHQKTVISSYNCFDNEQDEIFSKTITKTNSQNFGNSKYKRHLEDDNICESKSKKIKQTSPKKKLNSRAPPPKITKTLPKNDCVFAKPQHPVRKLNKEQSLNNKLNESLPKNENVFAKPQHPVRKLNKEQSLNNKPNESLPKNDFVVNKPQHPVRKLNKEQSLNNIPNESLPKNDFIFDKPQHPVRKLNKEQSLNNEPNESLPKNDCVFAKPQCPLRNLNKDQSIDQKLSEQSNKRIGKQTKVLQDFIRSKNNEKVISKSSNGSKEDSEPQPLPELIISHSGQNLSKKPREQLLSKSISSVNKDNCEFQDKDQTTSEVIDMSSRPSFIKRKLFSQKIDMGDNKNSSSDCIESNSLQGDVYSEIQKEKNRTRKLVSNQSCLSRDILQDDSNLLDLIQKLVPSDRLNATNSLNRTEIISKSKSKNDYMNVNPAVNGSKVNTKLNSNTKWEVLEAIAAASFENTGNISDTYTDEEIFECHATSTRESVKNKNIDNITKNNSKATKPAATDKNNIKEKEPVSKCEIVIEKLPQSITNEFISAHDTSKPHYKNRGFQGIVNRFWDSDIESDIDNCRTPLKLPQLQKNVKPVSSFSKNLNSKNNSLMAETLHSKESAPLTTKPAQKLSTISLSKGRNNKQPNKNVKDEKTANMKSQNNLPKLSANKPKSNSKNTTISNGGINIPQPPNKKITLDNNKSNNLSQNESMGKKKGGRPNRKPKDNLCCTRQSKNENSFDDSTDTVYRNLRGRMVNMSTSISEKRKTALTFKNKDDSLNDSSFTLPCSKSTVNKTGNKTVCTRRSNQIATKKNGLNNSHRLNNLTLNKSPRMCLRSSFGRKKNKL